MSRKSRNESAIKKRKISWFDGVSILAVLIGLGVFLYPIISDAWNTWRQSLLATNYTASITEVNTDQYEDLLAEAEEYNRQHTALALDDPYIQSGSGSSRYHEFLNNGNSDVMGILNIPRINQQLMIYYGTGDDELSQGVGHMEGSSLPVGGKGTHSVLAGHRGLPTAKLFSDLDQMKEGDLFFITVLNRKMAYKVDQILVIDPDEVSAIEVDPGQDYVTLLTCTPYGVNTQRLLVRGVRTDLPPEEIERQIEESRPLPVWMITLITLLIFILLLFAVWLYRKIRRKADQ